VKTQPRTVPLDVILVTGDAHVDHPAFAAAILKRALEADGFKVGVIARPDVADVASMRVLGEPRLLFGVTAGALDSMVANYTALNKRRSDDPNAPDGRAGGRPDRALTVYCNLLRRAFGKAVPIVAGGLEASLRRFSHYDYWSDSVRRPALLDCGADLLVHGPGEGPLVALANALGRGGRSKPGHADIEVARELDGFMWKEPASRPPPGGVELPRHEEVAEDHEVHLRAHQLQESHRHSRMWQACSGMRVVANPPWRYASEDLDRLYGLPFSRDPAPVHGGARIPALEQVRFSVTSHRGCAGGCAFCAISAHQGKQVVSRSKASVLAEVERIVRHPAFRGTIPDIGGPTANMYGAACDRREPCRRVSCLWPSRCPDFSCDQEAYAGLLVEASKVEGLKHLFVTTGLRPDLAMGCSRLVEALTLKHTSGNLKVAPEHIVPEVLKAMRKPADGSFLRLLEMHRELSAKSGRRQNVLPYLMAAHPGCTMEHMVDLALFLKKHRLVAEQCQIFTPTPGSASAVMYATGLDITSGAPIFVERHPRRKKMQKALILYHLDESRPLIREALRLCRREDALAKLLRR
jgi:uncharacterized radical SAM protein YgiQ